MIKQTLKIIERIGSTTWSGYTEKGRSLDNTVGGQPAGKSLKRRVADNTVPDHDGKSAPYGSAYKKVKDLDEMSATAKKHGKFGLTNVPFPTEEPNEFAYLDFVKYVKKNEKKIMKALSNVRGERMFKAIESVWSNWDDKANKGAFSNIRGNKFGRALVLMLRKDDLVFQNTGNNITNLKEKYNIRKQSCTQSDGDKGNTVLYYTTKKGKKRSNCHTSKKNAKDQIAAIEGP